MECVFIDRNSGTQRLRLLAPLVFFILVSLCSLAAQDTLHIDPLHYSIDPTLGLAVCNSPLDELIANQNVQVVQLDKAYNLAMPVTEFELAKSYTLSTTIGETLQLYFTELPLVVLQSDALIVDEPRVLARLSLLPSTGTALQALIGIEHKGGWTQTLAKKSYRLELWADSLGLETEKVSLLGMRSDDDWNMEAMFNEPLRMRNVTNAKLWAELHTPYYLDSEPDAKAAIELRYVEVFLDKQYQGVYALSERIDRKLLKLKKEDGTRRGELFKGYTWGASTFGNVPDFDNQSNMWGGFDHIYPEESIEWESIHDFVDFVINGEHEAFYEDWDKGFERTNALDYFIFLNVIRALDNTGKNIYIARYDEGEPYFYVPFDLDGTYGVKWDGEITDASSDILTNGFYDRLLTDCNAEGFSTELKAKWRALRLGLLSNEQLKQNGRQNHTHLKGNGVYEREGLAWPSYVYEESNLGQFESWIDKRMELLDEYFELLCEDVGVEQSENRWVGISKVGIGKYVLLNAEGIADYSCTVYNSSGQQVIKTTNESLIDVSTYPAGLYILNLKQEGRESFYKLLLEI